MGHYDITKRVSREIHRQTDRQTNGLTDKHLRKVTRMTTSISSEARRNQTSILIRGRENHVSPKPDGQTDIRTDGHADGGLDISIYRVASLLKKTMVYITLIYYSIVNMEQLRKV